MRLNSQNRRSVVLVNSVNSLNSRAMVQEAVRLHRIALAKRPAGGERQPTAGTTGATHPGSLARGAGSLGYQPAAPDCRPALRDRSPFSVMHRPLAGGSRARLWASLVLSRRDRT